MHKQIMDILNELSQMDYGSIIKHIIPVVCFMAGDKAISSYSLHKDFKIKDISKVSVPPELKQKYSSVDFEHIASKQFKEITLEFANLMIEKFPPTSLINFYNNINKVKINRSFMSLLLCFTGSYSVELNKITVVSISRIYHELFHMASSIDKEVITKDGSKIRFCGFRQYDDKFKIDIGIGLNEGYTELLTHRYFGKKHKLPKSHKHTVNIVEKLEKIIEKDKMESLYFNADLRGLINELKKYTSEEEIAKFITGVDLISRHSYDTFRSKKLEESIINVYEFLFKTYMMKLKLQLENGKINTNEFIKQFTDYTQSLGSNIRIKGHKYEFLTLNKLLEDLKSILDCSKVPNDIQNIYDLKR